MNVKAYKSRLKRKCGEALVNKIQYIDHQHKYRSEKFLKELNELISQMKLPDARRTVAKDVMYSRQNL